MPISKDKLILILGMVCLEQGNSATLSSIRGKFQINSITAFFLCLMDSLLLIPLLVHGNIREANFFRNVIGFQKYFFGFCSCAKHIKLKWNIYGWVGSKYFLLVLPTDLEYLLIWMHYTILYPFMEKFWRSSQVWKHFKSSGKLSCSVTYSVNDFFGLDYNKLKTVVGKLLCSQTLPAWRINVFSVSASVTSRNTEFYV